MRDKSEMAAEKELNKKVITSSQKEQSYSKIEKPYANRWQTLAVLAVCVLMVAIDNTIVNIALPTLAVELSATISQLQWIVEAYVLVLTGLLFTSGRLDDRFGSRRMLIIGLIIFGAASVMAAFVNSSILLIAARGVMGVGGALVMPATLSIIRHVFPERERGKAIAIWGGVASVGIAAGPLAGGWLLEHLWWGSIFLVNLPVVAIALAGVIWLIPSIAPLNQNPLDCLGTVLSIAAIVGLVFALIEGPHFGWTYPLVLGGFTTGFILLGIFIWWELRTRYPLLDLKLFRNPRLSAASLSVTLAYFALAAMMFILTQHLQLVLGYTPLEAGLAFIPVTIVILVAGISGAWLAARLGSKVVVTGGLVITALGLLVFSTISTVSGYELVLVMLVLCAGGVGLASTAATDSIIGAVPDHAAGSGAALDELNIELGNVLGIALLGSVLAASYASNLGDVAGLNVAQASQIKESLGSAVQLAAQLDPDTGAKLLSLVREAFVGATNFTMLIGAGITFIGALIALFFLPSFKSISHSLNTTKKPTD